MVLPEQMLLVRGKRFDLVRHHEARGNGRDWCGCEGWRVW